MPVHFNSFIAEEKEQLKTKLYSDIVTKYTEKADDIFTTEDKTKIIMTSYFEDINTKNNIGKVVITLLVRTDCIEIVDTDIVLLTDSKIKLHFEEKLKESSEANEYYVVYDLAQERHFIIETVNRYTINDELEGRDQEVYLSAFPFKLDIFENEKEMNKSLGLGKEINIPGIGKSPISFSSRMLADGRIMGGIKEPCSFIIGQVKDFLAVEVDIAGNILKFKIIYLETGVGIMPVVVSDENFDLHKLKQDALIVMFADIKADFKR